MRLTGIQTTKTEAVIEILPTEIWRVLRQAILRKYGMHYAEYSREVNGKREFRADEFSGSISEVVVIANPTETQLAVWDAIKQLEKLAEFGTLGVE